MGHQLPESNWHLRADRKVNRALGNLKEDSSFCKREILMFEEKLAVVETCCLLIEVKKKPTPGYLPEP